MPDGDGEGGLAERRVALGVRGVKRPRARGEAGAEEGASKVKDLRDKVRGRQVKSDTFKSLFHSGSNKHQPLDAFGRGF